MSEFISEIVIVIPSLSPDKILMNYTRDLIRYGFNNIIVINDGSSEEYEYVYDYLKEFKEIIVLRHNINKGKGAALKTAFNYIKKNKKGIKGVLTVDSDGQHLPSDCVKIANEMLKGERALYLGCRDLYNSKVPIKSRIGNKLTSILFKLLYKQDLNDTQTGLRGFLINDLDMMINIEGERYEYEMEQLIKTSISNIKIICIPIETIYISDNKGSHFNALKDGLKVYKILFRKHK